MNEKPLHLLILEDSTDDAELAVKELEREGFTVEWSRVDTEKAFREAIEKKPDLILVDYVVPSFSGTDALKMQQEIAPDIPLIIVSGKIGEEVAVECMKSGATDYVLKDRLFRLGPAVKRALEEAEEHMARKQTEERIRRLNSILKAIRRVNQLAVFEKDRDSLLQKACDALIEARGYDGAWLGFLKDKKTFETVVGSGLREDVSRFIEHVMGGDHPPCIRNALVQKHLLMMVDKSKMCRDCFFKSACIGKEAAIIRVEHAGRFFGLLAILFAPDVRADEEEKGLLKEVASDMAFALHAMEMEEARKQAEDRIEHLNSVLRAIRSVNQLITKEKNRDRLIKTSCDKLIKTCGYYNTWIALLDENGHLLKTAEAGLGKDFLHIVERLKRGELTKCARKALSQSDVVITEDPLSTCTDCPLAKMYAGRGAMTVQLEHGGKLYGLLSVSIPRDFARDKEEQSLLEEVAGDIAFALHNLELEEAHKLADEALKESEERYRTLVESTTDAILMMDNERRVVSCNSAFLDLFGYDKNEIEGKSIRIIHQSDESFRSFGENTYPVIEKVGFFRGEWDFMRKDGTIFPVETVTSAIKSPDGSIIGYAAIIRDITERTQAEEEKKKVEAQLQQAQKMEAIGTLAGGIAHDFNNILSLIIGYTELTMRDFPEDSRAQDNMNKVLKASERARDLVKQILAFSRHTEQEQKPVQIHLIVKESLKLLRPTLPTTIEIHQNISSTGTVMADPTQVHQVIMNLSANAYHAMQEKGGVLEISLADVKLDSDFTARHPDIYPGPYLKLTVSDTGHGIKKKDIDRIFEPYYTTKEKTGGTGMGLAVVHGIVKSHGGVISVYSEPGKGSTFHVFLPRIEGAEDVVEPEEIIPLPIGKERILFVDDEPFICEIGKGMLEHLGYTVVTRTSPIEALEAFKAQPDKFDLVITDMTMPKMTGDELAKELMRIRPDLPIILCTGFSELIDEDKAKALGIRAFVMKPIVQREMAEAVRKALDQPSTF